MIDDDETIIRSPHSDCDPRVSVTIRDSRNPWPVVLFFSSLGDDAVVGLEIGESTLAPADLDLRKVTRAVANLGLYMEYARAWILLDRAEVSRALAAFKNLGRTKRGLPEAFIKLIGDEYTMRRRAGEPHPTKGIATAHHVDKSTASRWITEARKRGFLADTRAEGSEIDAS